MNHYERLKVSPDAPIEVIRAAYRALAAKHHPDRHTQSESSHGDMVALNAAYEVLTDASARAAYDAELAQAEAAAAPESSEGGSRLHNLWRSTMGFGGDSVQPAPLQGGADESRVDVHWQPPMPPELANPWLSRKRLIPKLSVLGVVVLIGGIWWVRAAMLQMEAEQALSQHYGNRLQQAALSGKPGAASRKVPMTDEELLAEPIPAPAQVRSSLAQSNHLLDGSPLNLRQDNKLVDPLALPPTSAPHP